MNTTLTTAPSLQIVGYGVEMSGSPTRLFMCNPGAVLPHEQCVPLVRESDALAAIEALRVEASNAATIAGLSAKYIEAMRTERDALAAMPAGPGEPT